MITEEDIENKNASVCIRCGEVARGSEISSHCLSTSHWSYITYSNQNFNCALCGYVFPGEELDPVLEQELKKGI